MKKEQLKIGDEVFFINRFDSFLKKGKVTKIGEHYAKIAFEQEQMTPFCDVYFTLREYDDSKIKLLKAKERLHKKVYKRHEQWIQLFRKCNEAKTAKAERILLDELYRYVISAAAKEVEQYVSNSIRDLHITKDEILKENRKYVAMLARLRIKENLNEIERCVWNSKDLCFDAFTITCLYKLKMLVAEQWLDFTKGKADLAYDQNALNKSLFTTRMENENEK